MTFHLTKDQLKKDLYVAYYDARKHKSHKPYVKYFEADLTTELDTLCNELWNRTYTAQPSKCFIIDYPKKREVFAARFRDRIVHHLLFNYIHAMLERTFIRDSYSCIKGRGTHDGIRRLYKHIKQESQNYTVPCYIMKLDIRGYFMHINRSKLLQIALKSLREMGEHKIGKTGYNGQVFGKGILWKEAVDMGFVSWLTEKIIMLNPKTWCEMAGSIEDWKGLDRSKSLFYTKEGCGLPIGNLTSQLFSNVYLNVLDQFMKRVLKCRHYGRYVDDFYIVNCDRKWLLGLVGRIENFLADNLELKLHRGKLILRSVQTGIEFLGAFLKPYRKYFANSSLRRVCQRLSEIRHSDAETSWRTVNSYLGIMGHYSTFYLRWRLFMRCCYLRIAPIEVGSSKMLRPYCINV